MSEWVEGQLESGADGGTADNATGDDVAADGASLNGDTADQGSLESPTPLSGAELGLTDEPNSFEPEEADPAVTADDEAPDPAET